MQVSAINFSNNFKGYDDDAIIDVTSQEHHVTFDEAADKIDFDKLATKIKDTGKTDKKTTPLKFGLVTLLLGAGSFIATKKVSQKTLKAITNKLSLDAPLNKTAENISKNLEKMKTLQPVDVTSVKTFFTNLFNKSRKWIAQATEKFGKAGLTAEETSKAAPWVRNAVRKAASIALAAGVSLGVVREQYKDSDKNNIPDKLEEISNGAKTATSILGIINDAILD